MAGTGTKRIIELTEASTIQNGDFIAVDSNARGTKKVSTDTLATSAALTAETNARAGADEQMSERMDGIEEQTALIQNPTKTLSGALVSFTDGANMPMVACTAEIVPKQSGSGTPSPDNVRPISGWESVTIADYAVNMLTEQTNEKRPCFIKKGTQIVASAKKDGDGNAYFYYYRADGSQIDYWVLSGTTDGRSWRNITLAEDVYFVAFLGSGVTLSERQVALAPTIEYSETLANVTTTPLGRTVYGGTLDVVTGVLTVDKILITPTAVDSVRYDTTRNLYWCALTISPKAPSDNNADLISNMFESHAGLAVGCCYVTSAGGLIVFIHPDQTLTTKEAMDAWLADNDLQFCYLLRTPQTYTLTGQEINTLLGDNNVWADSGDVEITYRRDISIVLENLENALSGSNSLNTMMMSPPTENTAEEPTEDEAEDDMR